MNNFWLVFTLIILLAWFTIFCVKRFTGGGKDGAR